HPGGRSAVIERRREGAERGAGQPAGTPDQDRSRRAVHVTHFGFPVHRSRLATRIAAMGAALTAVAALATGASPIAAAQYATTAAPKAYVGLFGDNDVAVIDTARNQVTKIIP